MARFTSRRRRRRLLQTNTPTSLATASSSLARSAQSFSAGSLITGRFLRRL